MNVPVYMYKFEIGDIRLFGFNAILGTFSCVILALFIKTNSFMEWIGRNTLAILFSHFALQRFFYLVINIIFPSMKKEYGEYVWSMTPFWIVTFIFLVPAACLFAYIMERFFPSFIGKGKLKKCVRIYGNDLVNKILPIAS